MPCSERNLYTWMQYVTQNYIRDGHIIGAAVTFDFRLIIYLTRLLEAIHNCTEENIQISHYSMFFLTYSHKLFNRPSGKLYRSIMNSPSSMLLVMFISGVLLSVTI